MARTRRTFTPEFKLQIITSSKKTMIRKKGWQYLVKIESDKEIQFSIMDNTIYLNDKIYVSNNLNTE